MSNNGSVKTENVRNHKNILIPSSTFEELQPNYCEDIKKRRKKRKILLYLFDIHPIIS